MIGVIAGLFLLLGGIYIIYIISRQPSGESNQTTTNDVPQLFPSADIHPIPQPEEKTQDSVVDSTVCEKQALDFAAVTTPNSVIICYPAVVTHEV